MNILLIPMAAPYDGVKHAGGNIANFYLNAYVEQSDMEITLITWQSNNEIGKYYYQKRGFKFSFMTRVALIKNFTIRYIKWLMRFMQAICLMFHI